MKLLMCFMLTSVFMVGTVNARELSEVKSEILKLAESYKGQMDEDGSKQEALEVLVDELVAQIPEMTMAEKAKKAMGVWNQVWGPYAFDDNNRMPPGIKFDKIYQYISPNGYYYNFAEYKLLGMNVKSYLRGVYSLEDDRINVQFTKTGLIRGRDAVDYAVAGEKIEQGKLKVFNFPSSIPPVGIKGALVEVYADEDMRINYGVVGDDLRKSAIFVMKRIK